MQTHWDIPWHTCLNTYNFTQIPCALCAIFSCTGTKKEEKKTLYNQFNRNFTVRRHSDGDFVFSIPGLNNMKTKPCKQLTKLHDIEFFKTIYKEYSHVAFFTKEYLPNFAVQCSFFDRSAINSGTIGSKTHLRS